MKWTNIVIAATGHTCAQRILDNGSWDTYCWGAGAGGALGLGDEKNRSRATFVTKGRPSGAGPSTSCISGVASPNKELCSGDNRKGILGIAGLPKEKLLTPQATLEIYDRPFGAEFSCYLLGSNKTGSNRQTLCAGKNGQGQLGKPGPDADIAVVVAY